MQNDVHTFARRYIALNGAEALEEYLFHLREEFEALRIPGLPEVKGLWECPAGSLPAEYVGAAGKPFRLLEKSTGCGPGGCSCCRQLRHHGRSGQ